LSSGCRSGRRVSASNPLDAGRLAGQLPRAGTGGHLDVPTIRRRHDRRRAPHLRGRVHRGRGRPAQPGVLRGRRPLPDPRHADRLLDHQAPDFTYDDIYALGSGLINVAEAKPGDQDFNGGRWMVLPVTWAVGVTPTQLTSAEQVHAYAAAGMLTIASTPVRQFLCPVIPVGGN
jgi:hypothetical protein